ncbi:hypothetical protein [Flaviflexus huanghaiensis]|uniref:hypothetical protein n=1 Tax=Flaviflexus huanghaiensis TaxID=1111473 RepID=UPI0015FA685A|nr:hypothetical protein [Flaviflexus huanghaiensis]
MLFRRRRSDAAPVRVTDPVIDAQIHWLGARGLILRDGISSTEWIAATDDPTDPTSLAEAHIDGRLCVQPDPMVTLSGSDLVRLVHELADGLELPIDEVTLEADVLKLRSASTHLTFHVAGRENIDVLRDVAEEFVDSAHVLLVDGATFAVAHRDIAEMAAAVLTRL